MSYAARGKPSGGNEILNWHEGNIFVIPGAVTFYYYAGGETSALYFVTDQPLLQYLGVAPCTERFEYTIFPSKTLLTAVEDIACKGVHRNRLGVLLATKNTERTTRTLTHTLWCLLNKLPAGQSQPPHLHNSVALDLVISAPKDGCYTLLGPELTKNGAVKDPVRVDWISGSVFTTPPSWWHSHHNESAEDAWVLPVQDAGILTHQRILGIEFVDS